MGREHQTAQKAASEQHAAPRATPAGSVPGQDQVQRGTPRGIRAVSNPQRQPADLLALQRLAGNQAVLRMLQREVATGTQFGGVKQSPFITQDVWNQKSEQEKYPFNEEKAWKDVDTLKERLTKYPQLNNEAFIGLFRQYVIALKNYDRKAAWSLVDRIINMMKKQHVFKVGTRIYENVAAEGGGEGAVQKAAEHAVQHIQLWSKLNKYLAIDAANEERGVSLESSIAGSLFDDLNFGATYAEGSLLNAQWKKVSEQFISSVRGTIHARVFEGVVANSVLTNTEWPKIKIYLDMGKVDALIVHIFELQGEKLVETSQRVVKNESDWNALPRVDMSDKGFWQRQNKVQQSQEKEHRFKEEAERLGGLAGLFSDEPGVQEIIQSPAVLEPSAEAS